MQTTFTLAQLADPDVAEADKILRACVHCGFCTATCPTYVLLGDELDSPRGRIYLIKDMLENDRPADRGGGEAYRPLPVVPRLHDHLPVGRALHAPRRSRARAYRGDLSRGRGPTALMRALLAAVLPYPGRFRAALAAGWLRAAAGWRPGSRRAPARKAVPSGQAGSASRAACWRCSACCRRGCRTARRTSGPPCSRSRVRARAASRCCTAAPSRARARRSTRRRSACSPARASRWCWRRAKAAAARWCITWAARRRRSRRRAPTSTRGRARSKTAGSMQS